jgi:hypothetical protein
MVALVGATSQCLAQGTNGNVTGTVTDSTGAVIAGATVTATNDSTGEKRTAVTTDSGAYNITNLSVGVYTITTTASGFSPNTVQNVKVTVGFTATADLVLNPAGAQETVVVTSGDAATQLNTSDAQLSTIIEQKKILDLPLLSRDPSALILLSPGVASTTSSLGGFVVNGQRPRNNNFKVDGLDDNDAQVPGIAGGTSTPNIDAIQEFRVITNNFNAEYGRNTGAIILNSTRSGTNDFHGGGYIYYRSDRFAARNFFDITGEADPLDRKQFGATIGGPIVRDRAFFFFNYEGDRFKRSEQVTRIVPSLNARKGILTGTAFGTLDLRPGSPNNLLGLPLDPAIQTILNLYPAPNSPSDALLPGIFEGYRFVQPINDTSNQYVTRIDVRITDRHNLSGNYRFAKGDFYAGIPATFAGTGDELRTPQTSQGLSLNLVSTLAPTITNELRFGGNRSVNFFNGAGDGAADASIFQSIRSAFSSNGYAVPAPFGGTNGSLIGLTVLPGISDIDPFDTQFRFAGTTEIGDSLTWVWNNHTFKTGGEMRWVYFNGADNFFRSVDYRFDASSTFGFPFILDNSGHPLATSNASAPGTLAGTLNDFASLLYGVVRTQFQSQFFDKNGNRTNADYKGFRTREGGVFFQDTWRVKQNFSLNFGLRWEYQSPPYEVNGQLSTLVDQDPSGFEPAGGFRFQLVGKNSGNNLNLWQNDLNNFAPRFGFNWSPGSETGFISKLTGGPGRTTIRGGYGVFYDRVFGNLFTNAKGNPPFQQDYFGIIFDTLENTPAIPTLEASPIVPDAAGIFPVLFALPGNNQFQTKFATPYTQAWNFGFQREISNGFLIEADYVGNKGTNLLRVIDGQLNSIPRVNAITGSHCAISTSANNNLFSGCSALNDEFFQAALNLSTGFSTYNAMQLRVTKALTNKRVGLGQIQAAYTWSHSIDNAADALAAEEGERNFPRDSTGFTGGWNAERGNSGFDVRHRFVLNYIYEAPFKFENTVLQTLLGNWSMSGIYQVQSGYPFSIFSASDSGGTGLSQRANYNPNPGTAPTITNPRVQTGPTSNLFSNPVPPPAGSTSGVIGNVSRNSWRGPNFSKFDLSLIKRIPFGPDDRMRFTLRADFFNLFNRVNFNQPINTITDPRFGQSTEAGDGRIIQFVGRFDF